MSEMVLGHGVEPAAAKGQIGGSWQTIAVAVGLIVVVLGIAYCLYRFVAQTNKKLKAVEQALHTLSERVKPQQQSAQPMFTRHHESFMMPPPTVSVPMPPAAPPVVIDAKTLDKELTEELKELSVEVEEGRVDAEAKA